MKITQVPYEYFKSLGKFRAKVSKYVDAYNHIKSMPLNSAIRVTLPEVDYRFSSLCSFQFHHRNHYNYRVSVKRVGETEYIIGKIKKIK